MFLTFNDVVYSWDGRRIQACLPAPMQGPWTWGTGLCGQSAKKVNSKY